MKNVKQALALCVLICASSACTHAYTYSTEERSTWHHRPLKDIQWHNPAAVVTTTTDTAYDIATIPLRACAGN